MLSSLSDEEDLHLILQFIPPKVGQNGMYLKILCFLIYDIPIGKSYAFETSSSVAYDLDVANQFSNPLSFAVPAIMSCIQQIYCDIYSRVFIIEGKNSDCAFTKSRSRLVCLYHIAINSYLSFTMH